jgi:F-type H+-transporting ATPase subunit a
VTFLVEGPPITHPTVRVCDGPSLFCTFSWDSLASSAVAILITVAIVLYVSSRLSIGVPGKLQMVFELLYGYIRGLVRETVGETADFVIPLAMTIFVYILVANWLELLPLPPPLLHPANSDLNQTAAMAAVVFVVLHAYAIRVQGLGGYLRYYTRPFDLPWVVRIFPFVFLNIIEEIAKPLTLALRLFGNLFGGIVMLYVLAVLLPSVPVPVLPTIVATVLVAIWKLFDVFVIGTLQALIFMLLTVVYFGLAREGLEEEHGQGSHHAPAARPAAASPAPASQ